MRKAIFTALAVIFLIGFIGVALRKRDSPHHPTGITGGLHYTIPYKKKDKWYIRGLTSPSSKHQLSSFLLNEVSDKEIDGTTVYFDDDLRASSDIRYISAPLLPNVNPRYVHLFIQGNIDPQKVKAFIRRY